MMLFKLSFRNLRKSFHDYMIYFVTLVLGVAIFYVFNAMGDQSVMLKVSEATFDIIGFMKKMMSVISVFVAFVLGFLIVYASNFLLRRRKKEFGIYGVLGMSKLRIASIILTETLMIGMISLFIGLVIGIAASQGVSILIANMFEADMTEFTFIVSRGAIVKTMLYFCIMFLVVLVLDIFTVGRTKLIDLFYAGRKSEKHFGRNPWLCLIVFCAASGILGTAYYSVTAGAVLLKTEQDVLVEIVKGIIGTFMVFWSLSGLMIFMAKRSRKFTYRGIRIFTVKEFAGRINTTFFSGSIICLMLFITICVLSSAMSVRKAINDNLKKMVPVDVNIYAYADEENNSDVAEILDKAGIDMDMFRDIVTFKSYMSRKLSYGDTMGAAQAFAGDESFVEFVYNIWERVVFLSDYNRLAELYGFDALELKENEYAVACNNYDWLEKRNEGLLNYPVIVIGNKEYVPKYNYCLDSFILMSSTKSNGGFVIVPDSADLSDFDVLADYFIANYNAADAREYQEIADYIDSYDFTYVVNPPDRSGPYVQKNTKSYIYDSSIGYSAMMVFIGIYLGLIFMIFSAAILSLKELSESLDNYGKYQILRKIGVDEGQINRSLFMQCFLFFVIPLAGAVIHSIFGIQVCNSILESYGRSGFLYSIVVTALMIVVVYGVYFAVTYFCSKNIIRE